MAEELCLNFIKTTVVTVASQMKVKYCCSSDLFSYVSDVGGGSSGLSAGGVVGVVFFCIFLLLAVVLVVLFIMRRRAQEPTFLRGLINDSSPASGTGGFENPSYESTKAAAENVLGSEEMGGDSLA